MADIPLGNVVEENYELTITGLHTAIYNRVLFDDFYLNGKILTKEKNGVNVVSLVKQFIADKDECTFEEAHSKVGEDRGHEACDRHIHCGIDCRDWRRKAPRLSRRHGHGRCARRDGRWVLD